MRQRQLCFLDPTDDTNQKWRRDLSQKHVLQLQYGSKMMSARYFCNKRDLQNDDLRDYQMSSLVIPCHDLYHHQTSVLILIWMKLDRYCKGYGLNSDCIIN